MRCIPHQWKQDNSKCDAGVNRRKRVAILQSTQAISAFQDARRWQLAILLWHEMAVNNIEANTVCSQPKIKTYKALLKMTWKKQKLCRKIVLIDFCINEGNNAAISAIGEAGRWQLVLLQFDQMRTILRQVAATEGSSDSELVPLSRQLTEMLRRPLGSSIVISWARYSFSLFHNLVSSVGFSISLHKFQPKGWKYSLNLALAPR